MRNHTAIDHKHSQAICDEIGERLRSYFKVEPAAATKELIRRYRASGSTRFFTAISRKCGAESR